MKPQDLRDKATSIYEGGGDAFLGDFMDDCAMAWDQDRERIAELESELLEEKKKSAYLSQLRPHSVTEKELARHDNLVIADELDDFVAWAIRHCNHVGRRLGVVTPKDIYSEANKRACKFRDKAEGIE